MWTGYRYDIAAEFSVGRIAQLAVKVTHIFHTN